ncbi:MAG: Altronate dehydratase [Smithella sp. PtaU1.Bin162]|nr:MAG: Altronate dehydratase [Smithella sp. PtaU1.Bin162]
MPADAILIKKEDNVATALRDLELKREAVIRLDQDEKIITITEPIPFGHKFAVRKIIKGENILKYGEVIGRATRDIEAGAHAHIQNIESLRGRGDLEKEASVS